MLRLAAVVALTLATSPWAAAQQTRPDPYSARIALGAESYVWQQATPAPRAQARGGGVSQNYAALAARVRQAQPARRAPSRPAASLGANLPAQVPTGGGFKPFNHVVHSPTLSPYLNLYREEANEGAPNYHLLVRPQQQMNESNSRQAAQLQQLQRQVRQASYGPASTGGAARYGDTSHYYGGWR